MSIEQLSRFEKAFPDSIRSEVTAVEIEMSKSSVAAGYISSTTISDFPLQLGPRVLMIPSKINVQELSEQQIAAFNPEQIRIMNCLYTRHHDAVIREKYLMKILNETQEYVVPFVMQLLGEHIEEIGYIIFKKWKRINSPMYLAFSMQNPNFVRQTHQRIISFWRIYYKSKYREVSDYPSYIVFDQMSVD